MLAELEREYPNLGFTRYEEVLMGNGFAYVSQFVEEEVRQQLEILESDWGDQFAVVTCKADHATHPELKQEINYNACLSRTRSRPTVILFLE